MESGVEMLEPGRIQPNVGLEDRQAITGVEGVQQAIEGLVERLVGEAFPSRDAGCGGSWRGFGIDQEDAVRGEGLKLQILEQLRERGC
jgi:hypothetical protein